MSSETTRIEPLDAPALLRQWGLHPDKRLGQNFLVDEISLWKVVEAAGISPEDSILEIGPGLGSLTRHLARRARRVVAVELDGALIPPLRQVLAPYPNVEIVQGDILTLDPAALIVPGLSNRVQIADPASVSPGAPRSQASSPPLVGSYLVVANIPYYITSAVIRHLLEASLRPSRLVLTIQREVAERLTAGPGDLSLLALSVQVYGQPAIVARIPAGAFYPPPKVDSAVVRVDLYPDPLIPFPLLPLFFSLAKAGFSQKRKTLRNALSAGLALPPARVEAWLRSAGIDPMRRAETLSIPEWRKLAEIFAK